MRIQLLFIGLVFLFVSSNYAITTDGNAYLENQTDHSGIEVFLERIAPSSLIYTVYTNTNGDYTAEIETGLYEITFSKYDYFDTILSGQSLYTNTTFTSITMIEHTTTLFVPAIFSTIQYAMDVASTSDTVLVAPGTYYENINYNGKNITVASLFVTTQDTTYISQTIIDGN